MHTYTGEWASQTHAGPQSLMQKCARVSSRLLACCALARDKFTVTESRVETSFASGYTVCLPAAARCIIIIHRAAHNYYERAGTICANVFCIVVFLQVRRDQLLPTFSQCTLDVHLVIVLVIRDIPSRESLQ